MTVQAEHLGIGAPPGRRRSPGLILVMLTFIYVLNFLERQLLAILAKPIQDELQISDGRLGLVGGLYFATGRPLPTRRSRRQEAAAGRARQMPWRIPAICETSRVRNLQEASYGPPHPPCRRNCRADGPIDQTTYASANDFSDQPGPPAARSSRANVPPHSRH